MRDVPYRRVENLFKYRFSNRSMTVPNDPAEFTAKIAKWKKTLANMTEIVLPTDYPRFIPHRIVETETSLDISEASSMAILQLSMQNKMVSPFTILLASFAILLHKYTNEQDISVGSSSASSNPLVLRLAISEEDSMIKVIENVLKIENEAIENEVPFSELLKAMFTATSDEDFQPSLFKVRFYNMADTNNETLSKSSTSTSDLTIFISQTPTLRRLLPIQIRICYNSLLFSELRILDMLDQLELLLSSAVKNPTLPIGKISLVTPRNKLVIADPLADLDWDGFQGAITDIFDANARRTPDAICVVESLITDNDSFDSTQTFTYKQINDASNVLAHHLICNGIEREDVVVLFSYRGVDLVVAVMGVLKAGATFSVIDPAYPPSRQNIYLSVAKPRGLVILQKAGELDNEVRKYIDDNLQIKVEIPALQISPSGVLNGSKDGDIFAHDRAKADILPDIIIGPDSIGTLSFTSGSTGMPKGVRGRHYSLTHFYPWMKQEFNLTDKEKFTMLSGIAHDPIQRDIFTPLYLGAQLIIPTAEDIGCPGRLAHWMDHHKITITHLTPAMGQLLSANAVHSIPSLRNAFFVGDVLTKRDVNRLQYLASNCYMINMYGTTETQRAVSFLKIPPSNIHPGFLTEQKDIMPAGKGMKDVQLLVVNKSGLQCGVGEVGEIYVRSGGLAEGYLELEEVTASKFLENPFRNGVPLTTNRKLSHYKGPRDRIYRTGDLGRYQPNGEVECTGRADDQVKIRGFRIELGEIDTHLSQHPSIRENVTLVRRDKYEEQTLVSYFVPLQPPADLMMLLSDIREYLKLKLPSYAIPSVFVPLTKMPLTPNGKVDKNSLPFPDTVLSNMNFPGTIKTDQESTATQSEIGVRDIWSSLLSRPSNTISLDDKFFDIGGHSVLATRLIFVIRTKMSVVLPLGTVYKDPTVRGIAKEVDRIRDGELNLVNKDDEKHHTRSKSSGNEFSEDEDSDIIDYAADVARLDEPDLITNANLPAFKFPDINGKIHILVTGVTGFLGAFLVSALLQRFPQSVVVCHVRAKTKEVGLERIQSNSKRYLVWDDKWVNEKRIEAVVGDLAKPKLGCSDDVWNGLCKRIDMVVHNGALVHWVYPYEKLLGPNVKGTLEILKLCCTHHLKPLHFVSSTSVLDTRHYTKKIGQEGEAGMVMESDTLEGSRRGLRSGYGQTKWVAEKLVMNAKSRGVPVTIIRPGYIVGHTVTGVGNTDDFLWRLVKGCIQLGKVPKISNVINMCPVDYVASAVASICSNPDNLKGSFVYHAWHPHRFKFDDLFNGIAKHYKVEQTEYIHWRTCLMDLTLASSDHALYPLLHFVLDDLPTSTRSPELSDKNTREACTRDEMLVRTTGKGGVLLWKCPNVADYLDTYLGYLVRTKFLDAPELMELPSKVEWDQIDDSEVHAGRTGS